MTLSRAIEQARHAEAAARSAADAVRLPELLDAEEVLALYRTFDGIGRAAGTAKLLLARRVEEIGAAAQQGVASTAELLAQVSGTSVGAAKGDLETSKALGDLAVTRDAMLAGEVSPEQGKVIAGAAKQNPDAQGRLLRQARTGSHQELRDEAQRVRAEAEPDPEAKHRHIHAQRNLSMWTDHEGVWHLKAQGAITDGARIARAIEREADHVFRANASATDRAPRGAHAFDALTNLTTRPSADGRVSQPAPEHLAILRLDIAALKRGLVHDGELCEIVGVGPVPVSVAKALLGDAVLKLVITNGVDVLNVTSLTRGPTQAMKYAILWSSPTCTVAGCDRSICEYDHITGAEYAQTNHTRCDELDHLCTVHHDLHTNHGWALVAGKGKRPMVPPRHRDHPTKWAPTRAEPLARTPEELAQIAQGMADARAAVGARLHGREPPDPLGGPAPPEPVAANATPSLLG